MMEEKTVSEWFLGVECPYCHKLLSLTQKHIYVYTSISHSFRVIANCYNCKKNFILDFIFKG
jgi:hypothetical protein